MTSIRRPMMGLLAVVVLGLYGCDTDLASGVRDLDGKHVDPTTESAAPITVTLFVDSDCPQATEHDVAAVLDALLEGKAVDASWRPVPGRSLKTMSRPGVGCYIGDFK